MTKDDFIGITKLAANVMGRHSIYGRAKIEKLNAYEIYIDDPPIHPAFTIKANKDYSIKTVEMYKLYDNLNKFMSKIKQYMSDENNIVKDKKESDKLIDELMYTIEWVSQSKDNLNWYNGFFKNADEAKELEPLIEAINNEIDHLDRIELKLNDFYDSFKNTINKTGSST